MTTLDPSPQAGAFEADETLPETLPPEPFGLFVDWFDEASRLHLVPNPHAMVLATTDPDGAPQARTVLCKAIEPGLGYIVFYTNFDGPKGRQLTADARTEAVFNWDHQARQVRISGVVVKSPPEESDAYFKTRHWASRLGAWASDQSQPIASREELLLQVTETIDKLGIDPGELVALEEGAIDDIDIPRPPHWGGYRLWAQRVELWCGGRARVHDRAHWTRTLTPTHSGEGFTPGPWLSTRLQP